MRGATLALPNTLPWRGAQLKKQRDNFTCTFYSIPFLHML